MVNKTTAFKAAGLSAIVVGVITYLASGIVKNDLPIAIVAAMSVFIIGYWGMNQK